MNNIIQFPIREVTASDVLERVRVIKEKRTLSSFDRVLQECMEKVRLECSGFVLEEDDE